MRKKFKNLCQSISFILITDIYQSNQLLLLRRNRIEKRLWSTEVRGSFYLRTNDSLREVLILSPLVSLVEGDKVWIVLVLIELLLQKIHNQFCWLYLVPAGPMQIFHVISSSQQSVVSQSIFNNTLLQGYYLLPGVVV